MLSPSPFHLYRVIFLFCLLVAALRVAPALAQPAQRDFNIPPQALSSALKAYADNTNLQLLYPSEIAQGLRSNSVVRNRTPQEALSILLQGTGLSFRFVDDKTVTVSQAENSSQQDPTKTLRIEEIQVTAEREHDYRVQEATTATKTDTPLRDIPQLIQVINREVLEDRQIFRLKEVADNVSGVQYGSGYGGLSSAEYFIRGFSSFQNSLRNGFPDFGFLSSRDVANIERIEFLKGPASVLYGLAEPGGRVNTITKQPLPYSYYATSMTFGSYDFYRPTLDLSGPLNADRSLLYRFNVRKAWELCHQTAHCPIKIILGATVWLEEKYQQSPQGNMLNEDDPSIVAEANNGFAFLPAEGTRLTVGYTMEW